MAFHLPGTWEVTVHSDLGTVYPILVFTKDHSVIEIVDFAPETALGAWRWDDAEDGTFQFTEMRYTTHLPPNPPNGTIGTRLRAACQFPDPDTFTGSACIDALGDGRAILKLGFHQSTFTAVRMKVVPWQEDCTAP